MCRAPSLRPVSGLIIGRVWLPGADCSICYFGLLSLRFTSCLCAFHSLHRRPALACQLWRERHFPAHPDQKKPRSPRLRGLIVGPQPERLRLGAGL
jgi:hypothetical protein